MTSDVGQRERVTQHRVIRLLCDKLGYAYLGNWHDQPDNRNLHEGMLAAWLTRRGVNATLITRALHQLSQAAAVGGGRSLYDANRAVYGLLRYGVKVREGAGEQTQTVWLIDWENVDNNHFGVAEEVSIRGEASKRPDLVLYVNGIALGVLELKRSTVSVSEGIRQNLDNQKRDFIRPFFSTLQFVMAGNDTEGLRYGTIETKEKYYLTWKEEGADQAEEVARLAPYNALDRHLLQLCHKPRLLELVHDFLVFDQGTKKCCRHNQYFGVKAAQRRIAERQGGIIWHTQGSGKSLTMVWLAKWIREHVRDARVLILTDRTELDEQIEGVFAGVEEQIYRTRSGADLIAKLNDTMPWLLCSLIHKFGAREGAALDEFMAELEASAVGGFRAKDDLFVFVDECHRTQSGKLHKAMKKLLPAAMFIGFTGTPLLKTDKQTSIETFGPYIHTYKFDEAVRDQVVLDLLYEARDIDQNLTSKTKVDQWFEAKTRGLSDLARAQLKAKWGTLQKVLSSQDRLEKIVQDILMDMALRDRLVSGNGNAMLVSASIFQACKFYELFSESDLKGKCAIITSYRPTPNDIKGEETGEGLTERLRQYDIYRQMLADYFDEPIERAVNRAEEFEKEVKKKFVHEPGQMKLLIVVDKLLTGFDAPPATYLYIDKSMRDHGLFQAICRVNRLDGDDKQYGYVIDYKDLFNSLKGAVEDYTSGALDGYDQADVAGLLENRLDKAGQQLEEARETVAALLEAVAPPRNESAYLHYFCAADTSDKNALKENEPKRLTLYKAVASFVRAFANLANELPEAGYSEDEIETIRKEVSDAEAIRQVVKLASGDYVDMKLYEPAMRHLLDAYIRAEESVTLAKFEEMGLVKLIVENGLGALDQLPPGIRGNPEAMAETIENNIRKIILDEQPINPKYYERMSELLDALIQERKASALEYQEYLRKIQELASQVTKPEQGTTYPASLDSPAKRALYDNLDRNEILAIQVDAAVYASKRDDWRGHRVKEREVKIAIRRTLTAASSNDDASNGQEKVEEIFELVKNQREY